MPPRHHHLGRSDKLLARLHATSRAAGAVCLDDEWQGGEHRYRFRCDRAGHEWTRPGNVQRKNPRCPHCARATPGPLERLAGVAGVECLDTVWLGADHRYRLRCGEGHAWQRRGDALQQNPHCLKCKQVNKNAAGPFTEMLRACAAVGVTCLDTEAVSVRHRYRFRCARGHEWRRTGASAQLHPRCRDCVRIDQAEVQRAPDTLQRLQERARELGGACLSTRSANLRDKYRFRCAAGHEWETSATAVLKQGAWCRRCHWAAKADAQRLPDGLERLRGSAQEHGGECLDGEYLGTQHRYRFRCAGGHEWATTANKIFLGVWCRLCHFDARRLSLGDAQAAAHARGGTCLSDHYVNSSTKLRWLCDRGHEWAASLSAVRAGHWCRQCANIAMIRHGDSKARLRYDDAGARKLRL